MARDRSNCATEIAKGTHNALGELVRPFDLRYRRGAGRNDAGKVAIVEPCQKRAIEPVSNS